MKVGASLAIQISYINSIRDFIGTLSPNKIASDRYRRAAWTSSALISSQVLSILTGFVTIPLLVRYLESELFGLWMILINFISFLVFADLGIGVGLRNQLIRCFATNNQDEPGAWLANALLLTLSIGAIICLASLFIVPLIPVGKLFDTTSDETRQWMIPSIQSLGLSFSIGLPAMLLEYIGNAYQRGYWVYALMAAGRLLGLIGLCIGCHLQVTLPTLIAVFVTAPHFMCLLGLFLLCFRVPWLRPRGRDIRLWRIKKLFHVGIGMLGVRITHAIAMQGPAYLTASLQGLAGAGMIAVIQRVLIIPSTLTQSMLIATQGALGESAHKGEWLWVRRNLLRLTKINLIVFALTTVIVFLMGGWGLGILLNNASAAPSRVLLLLYCIYCGLIMIRFPFGTFLTIIDRVYIQSFYRAIFLLSTLFIVYSFEQTSASIIALFIILGELPTLFCTVSEAYWVFCNQNNMRISGTR